ncbi:hypothetical protein FRB99_007920 [Tulasnella sp. 403]|nr:hypothetical protein FRB99_007920 [Tulasnella sp. 403]
MSSTRVQRPSNDRTLLIIASVAGVTLLATFLSGALTVALPSIAQDLSIPDASLQWPVSMYSLVNGTFLLVAGGLADSLGRKTLFMTGTATFAGVSLAVSFTRSSVSFITLMSLLGIAPAILSPAAAGIIGASFPTGRVKAVAFAVLGAGQPIGFVAGLVSGGLLSKHWRAMYWLISGLSVTLGVMAFFSLPPDPQRTRILLQLKSFDWFGSLLSTIAAVSLIFALSDAGSTPDGWNKPYIPALLPTSATFIVSFLWWEEKRQISGKHVLLPLTIWKAKGLGVMIIVVFFAWASFNTMLYLSTLMYQQVQYLSPMKTTIYFIPNVAASVILNTIAGHLTGRVSTLKLICVGVLFSAGSCIAFSLLKMNSSYPFGMLWVMLLCVGPDLFFSAANLHIQNSVGPDQQALAGSLFMVSTRLATAFGLSICSTISSTITRRYQHGDISPAISILQGLRGAGWACLAFAVISLVVAVAGLRGTETLKHKRHSKDSDMIIGSPIIIASSPGRQGGIELVYINPEAKYDLAEISTVEFSSVDKAFGSKVLTPRQTPNVSRRSSITRSIE